MTSKSDQMARVALGDFTTNGRRLAMLSAIAAAIGIMGGLVAWVLLRLIGLITHLAYDGRVGWSLVAPNPSHWGILSVAVPIIGGLIVGLLAKYGTDKIRGHGIPEAIQAILENESKMEPRVAVVKPIASAITIGTGGPFGAEGPIIMTGGAIGSLVAQFFRLSSLERRTLLVAGAAAGMAATFGSPVSAVLLAVELLLFEWRPRSLVPVAIASALAEVVRSLLLGTAPVFATPATPGLPLSVLVWAALVGMAAGVMSGVLTKLVYFIEDTYRKLPIHWVWWPAIGGLIVGLGGLVDPRALGVGYPTIRALDAGHLLWTAALALFIVKAVIWIASLSSGTSGGVLAPLLLLGGALGTVLSAVFPGHDTAILATVGMAAMLGGTMRASFTATIFTMETTHNFALLLPVLVASVAGMAVTVLWIPRSILTEKVARRGVHVAREYGVHPLEGQSVAAIMTLRDQVVMFRESTPVMVAAQQCGAHASFPVVDGTGQVIGMVRRSEILSRQGERLSVGQLLHPLVWVNAWDRVRVLVELLARHDCNEAGVKGPSGEFVGFVTRTDAFKTWRKVLEEEEKRERVFGRRPAKTVVKDDDRPSSTRISY
ncbi:chloride channel protein [Sulfobacillus harzensis]|uniref:Chloride channel protein n=1 Tax=Sulfobacillus harzensis TaxID=2729629 RepID=A0A7Y0L9X8_9FIRM|nr:chloride channel protein [Sulfobacillus harzensis]NMP24579.1 chloride channel protein [Sulfobacillus harzensis]